MKRLTILALTLAYTPAFAADPRVFSLIVTNNRAMDLGRPDLRYADDDGAKYYQLFTTLAAKEDVKLLTDFDSDTARLFPSLVPIAQRPTRANVIAAAQALGRAAKEARQVGQEVEFYFVFAGHGDIDGGRGFLTLADGPLDSMGLEDLVLRAIPYTHAHVILDSCNSFFVLNPRKPGGRRFATPEDAARGLQQRLPNVGVFLSTSAESEVFEWSELQSGIFSHAVRSGLAGGADTNGDGRVTYEELAAFVDTAAREVRNPLYRPSVFARGPNGSQEGALIDLRASRAIRLRVEGGRRVTVRDGDDLPWIDVHTEPEGAVTLRLPDRLAPHFVVETRGSDNTVVSRFETHQPSTVEVLAQLEPVEIAPSARGAQELFRMLFVAPFGPHALVAWRSAGEMAQPVIGLAQEDGERMRLLLKHAAEIDRSRRIAGAVLYPLVGGLIAGAGGWLIHDASSPSSAFGGVPSTPNTAETGVGVGLVVLGGGFGIVGALVGALRLSKGEKLYRDFVQGMAGGDPLRMVAEVEVRLEKIRQEERTGRIVLGIGGGVLMATGIIGIAAATHDQLLFPLFGAGTIAGAGLLIQSFFESPLERIARLWTEDPGLRRIPPPRINVGMSASSKGGLISLSGVF